MKRLQILTQIQKEFLNFFAKSKLSEEFYLTGGTALAEYYIPYRNSEDLDFFSEEEISKEAIVVFLRSIKRKLNYITYDENTSFNRNIFILSFKDYLLKTKFTYFPFPQVETPKVIDGVKVDSIIDIAVNKLFTIYQKPRLRDFMDLYMICRKYDFSLDELGKKARIKFDWNIDLLKLGSQFLLVKDLKDFPRLISPMHNNDWQEFFLKEAKKLKEEIMM